MAYTFTGVAVAKPVGAPKVAIKTNIPVRLREQPAFATVPTQRNPTGLSVWWRPVAVGFPTTGTMAMPIGPRPYDPQRHVGAANTALLRAYASQQDQQRNVVARIARPSMVAVFDPMQTAAAMPDSQVVVTCAGPMRLPTGYWLNPFSPALMVGSR